MLDAEPADGHRGSRVCLMAAKGAYPYFFCLGRHQRRTACTLVLPPGRSRRGRRRVLLRHRAPARALRTGPAPWPATSPCWSATCAPRRSTATAWQTSAPSACCRDPPCRVRSPARAVLRRIIACCGCSRREDDLAWLPAYLP